MWMKTSFGATFPLNALSMMLSLLNSRLLDDHSVKNVDLYCVAAPYAHICCLLLLAGYYITVISRSRHTLFPVFSSERNVLFATFL